MPGHITAISHHLQTGTEMLCYLLDGHAALKSPVEASRRNLQAPTQILSSFLIYSTILAHKKPPRKPMKTNWLVAKKQMSQLMHYICFILCLGMGRIVDNQMPSFAYRQSESRPACIFC